MRHRKKFNHLGRKSAHRKSMMSNMASSLILHKRIKTTLAKAKALRTYVEPLITRSKEDTTHSRRMVFRELQNKDAVTELFREVSTRVAERPGGYTRIIKLGTRLGDNAEMALIELVDYNENLLAEKETAKAKSTRRGRRGGKKKAEETTEAAAAPAVEQPADEVAGEVKEEAAEEPKAEAEATAEPVAEAEEQPVAETPEEEPEAKAEVNEAEPEAKAEEEPKAEVNEAEPEAKTEEEPKAEETPETKAEEKKEQEEKDEEKKDNEDQKS